METLGEDDRGTSSEKETKDSIGRLKLEAEIFKTRLLEAEPDVKSIQTEFKALKMQLDESSARLGLPMKRLYFEMHLWQPLVEELVKDVNEVRSDINLLLMGSKSAVHGASSGDTMSPDELGEVLAYSDAEDAGCESNITDFKLESSCTKGSPVTVPFCADKSAVDSTASSSVAKSRVQCTDQMKQEGSVVSTLASLDKKEALEKNSIQRAFPCYICGVIPSNRRKHMTEVHPGEKCFPCKICGASFDFRHELKLHAQTNHNRQKSHSRQCYVCGKMMKSKKYLKYHLLNTHSYERPYTCSVCGKSFKQKVSAVRCTHRKVQQEFLDKCSGFRCAICDLPFSDILKFKGHCTAHNVTTDKLYKCKLCERTYIQPNRLNDHMAVHYGIRYPCDTCGSSYSTKLGLKKHITRDHKFPTKQLLTCKQCNVTFYKQKSLEEHMNVHSGKKPFECEVCHENFHSSRSLKHHIDFFHNEKFKCNKCDVCGKVFRSVSSRMIHCLSHTSEELKSHNIVIQMVECEVCGKSVVRGDYKRHMFKHKPKQRIICETCGTSFKDMLGLRYHRFSNPECRTQALEDSDLQLNSSRVCDICGKYFPNKTKLTYHKMIHTGETRYNCDVCGKAYIYKQGAQKCKHRIKGKYPCETCGRSFSLKDRLQFHIDSVHKHIKTFACDICGNCFAEKKGLKVHLRKHQREQQSAQQPVQQSDQRSVHQPGQQPVQQPDQEPAQQSVQQPGLQPVQQPVQQSMQQPGHQPVQQSDQEPDQQSVQQPGQQPVQQSDQEPVQQSMQQPGQQPVQQSDQEPAQQSVQQPSLQPVQQPVQQSVQELAQQLFQQPAQQSVQQPVQESVQQLFQQPAQQSVQQPDLQPVQQPSQQSVEQAFQSEICIQGFSDLNVVNMHTNNTTIVYIVETDISF